MISNLLGNQFLAMLKHGYYSQGHSDRKARKSKLFVKGKKSTKIKYERGGIGKGKIYTEDSVWVKILKLVEVIAILLIIGYISYLLLRSFVSGV